MIVAATGHRPERLGGYDIRAAHRLQNLAYGYLRHHRPDSVIVGGALGWDSEFLAAALLLGIPAHLYVPFDGHYAKWPGGAQRRFYQQLLLAASVTVVSAGGYTKQAMPRRNMAMVDACTHVCAMFDGSPSGTAQCVAYAERKGKPVENLYPQWQKAYQR